MKDVTEIFRKAADEHDTYYYETVRYALESDPEIWCVPDSDSNEKWAYIGRTENNDMVESYGFLCVDFPVALLKDNCPDKIRRTLDKCRVMHTSFDDELSCDEAVLREYLTEVLIIDDRFLEDESREFDEEAYQKILDGCRYTTPYRFAFDDLMYSYPHYTRSELDRMLVCDIEGVDLRRMLPSEYALLEDFLYEAIFIPDGIEPPPREIINKPELQVYIENFGSRSSDICVVAETDGKVVGAAWMRIMMDYGHISRFVPSIAISLYPEYRGQGIGTALMKCLMAEAIRAGYRILSLSVQKENYAYTMYRKLGFEVIKETNDEYIMRKVL